MMLRLAMGLLGCASLAACTTFGNMPPGDGSPYSGNYILGQIRLVATSYCPEGTVSADGHMLPIADNQVLFSLVGTRFGGDGRVDFGVPDLTARTLIGSGQGADRPNYPFGQPGGQPTAIILPRHSHDVVIANDLPNTGSPADAYLPRTGADSLPIYFDGNTVPDLTLQPETVSEAGTATPVPVGLYQPTLALRYCFVTSGIYPNRSALDEDDSQ